MLSVGYRLAPEFPFPLPLDDCVDSVRWAAAYSRELCVDPGRIAIGGESAGGNLAAATTLALRDGPPLPLRLQVLIYPVMSAAMDAPSYATFREGFGLTAKDMAWYWGHYVARQEDAAEPLASPLRAQSLQGLPAALALTAECDILRDEGEAYAGRLAAAGVPVRLQRCAGMPHGFLSLAEAPHALPPALDAIATIASALTDAFTD